MKDIKLTPEMSYVLGVLKGDGWLNFDGHSHYRTGLETKDLDFAKKFSNKLLKITGRKPLWVTIKRNFSKSTLAGLKAGYKYDGFSVRLNFKEWFEKFSRMKTETENLILNSAKDTKIEFLRGMFDSEGYFGYFKGRKKEPRRNLILVNKDLKLLRLVNKLLKENNINSHFYDRPKTGIPTIQVNDKNSLINFKNLIGFSIKRKQRNLLNSFKEN